MKKMFFSVTLLFVFTAVQAKICTISCTGNFPNSTMGYGYSWSQTGNGDCEIPTSGKVTYAVAGRLKGSSNVYVIDQGVCHVNDIAC